MKILNTIIGFFGFKKASAIEAMRFLSVESRQKLQTRREIEGGSMLGIDYKSDLAPFDIPNIFDLPKARLTMRIPGNVQVGYQINPDGWTDYEKRKATKIGINLENFRLVEVIPGLRERGSLRMPEKCFSTIDGYEIVLEKK